MEQQKISFEIEGIAPLKMDRWIDGGKQPKNEDGWLAQAEEKVYKNEKGDLAIPTKAIKAAMRMASGEVGRKMEGKKNRQSLVSMVFFEEEYLPLGKKKHDGIIKDIATRNTSGKITRMPIYRPHVKEWKVKGIMLNYGVPAEFLKETLTLAGLRYGLLGHRPEFGRFVVNKFEVS